MSSPTSQTALLSQAFNNSIPQLNFTNHSGKKASLFALSLYPTNGYIQQLCSFWGNISQNAGASVHASNVSTSSISTNLIKFGQLQLNAPLLFDNSSEALTSCNSLNEIFRDSNSLVVHNYNTIIADNQKLNIKVKGLFTQNEQTSYKFIF